VKYIVNYYRLGDYFFLKGSLGKLPHLMSAYQDEITDAVKELFSTDFNEARKFSSPMTASAVAAFLKKLCSTFVFMYTEEKTIINIVHNMKLGGNRIEEIYS
jgi:hypothetical protein